MYLTSRLATAHTFYAFLHTLFLSALEATAVFRPALLHAITRSLDPAGKWRVNTCRQHSPLTRLSEGLQRSLFTWRYPFVSKDTMLCRGRQTGCMFESSLTSSNVTGTVLLRSGAGRAEVAIAGAQHPLLGTGTFTGLLAEPSSQLLTGRGSSCRVAVTKHLVPTVLVPAHILTGHGRPASHFRQAQEVSSPSYATLSGPWLRRSMASSKNIFRVRSGS